MFQSALLLLFISCETEPWYVGFWSNTALPNATHCDKDYEAPDDTGEFASSFSVTNNVIEMSIQDEKIGHVIWASPNIQNAEELPPVEWNYSFHHVLEGSISQLDEKANGDVELKMTFSAAEQDVELNATLFAFTTNTNYCDYFEEADGEGSYTGGKISVIGPFHELQVELSPDNTTVGSLMQKVR